MYNKDMLKHLLFMRHAKSSWKKPELTDHQRPLNKRGRRSADVIGQVLHARGYAPDVIWASDSARTRETARRLVRVMPGPQMAAYEPGFYHASADEVLALCSAQGEPDCAALMLLGHNPGWEQLFEIFSGQPHAFPTAACAVFTRRGEGDWLAPESWRLADLLIARELLGQADG